jgi:hypothetical protein
MYAVGTATAENQYRGLAYRYYSVVPTIPGMRLSVTGQNLRSSVFIWGSIFLCSAFSVHGSSSHRQRHETPMGLCPSRPTRPKPSR